MSQRERWTIYPLLFFALLLGLKSQIPSCNYTGRFHDVECRELRVVDLDGQTAVTVSANPSGTGHIHVFGSDAASQKRASPLGEARIPKVRLSVSANGDGIIETHNQLGCRMVEITSNDTGGAVLVYDSEGRPKRVLLQLIHVNPAAPAGQQTTPTGDPRTAPVRPPRPPSS